MNIVDALSRAPADNGGVAVIVLGYTKSSLCCADEVGWAVKGVSGHVCTDGVTTVGRESESESELESEEGLLAEKRSMAET